MILTKERIEALRTPRGGFTGEVVRFLAGKSKPTRGWVRRAVGKPVDFIEYDRLLACMEYKRRYPEKYSESEEFHENQDLRSEHFARDATK